MIESWKKNSEGGISVCPLVAFELLISTSDAPRVSMQLKFAQQGDSLNNPTGLTQLVFTPAHAKELARALENAAHQALGGIDLTKLNNLL